MFPVLIDLGNWNLPFLGETHLFLPTYGVLYACGAVIAGLWVIRRGRSLGISQEHMFNICFYSLLGGLLGAKLLLILVEWRYYLANPMEILGTIRSAGVLIGGLVAGSLVFLLYCRRHSLPTWSVTDAAVAPMALGQMIGRIGCFSAGCCYGKPTHGHLALTFTDPIAAAQTGVPLNIPLVPTQLIEGFADLALVLFLVWMWRRRNAPGAVPGTQTWLYILIYSCTRFLIEFWRGDTVRGLWFQGTISTSQILSLLAAAAALAFLVRNRKLATAEEKQGT